MEFYKIYFDNKKVIIADEADFSFKDHNTLFAAFDNDKILGDLVQLLLTVNSIETLYVYGQNPQLIWESFSSKYTIIHAAGGLVTNKAGHALLIFRKGKWDLPKGKIEDGESTEEAALREVMEECGVKELSITAKVCNTYHIYTLNNQTILKISHWYAMRCNDSETTLKPQTIEGITEAIWMTVTDVLHIVDESYASVRDVLTRFFIKSL